MTQDMDPHDDIIIDVCDSPPMKIVFETKNTDQDAEEEGLLTPQVKNSQSLRLQQQRSSVLHVDTVTHKKHGQVSGLAIPQPCEPSEPLQPTTMTSRFEENDHAHLNK